MASYMADYTLNLAADHVTDRTIQVRIHSGAPGNNGTTNRIGAVAVNHPDSEWSNAASGDSVTNVASAFGVLSTSNETTVRAYSLWDGANFMGWADLDSPVTVAANESFSLDAGTVEFDFSR